MNRTNCMSASTIQANRAAYDAPGVVEAYARRNRLQPPERAVLDELRPRLADMRMLDIGVGAGRTTLHFAPLVEQYVGIDYAENMVRACRRRFPDAGDHVSFMTCDARRLEPFGDGSFDFVLFSFNGLDHIDHDGRLQVLDEVRRVLVPGGLFLFSAHNLNSVSRLFAFPWSEVTRRPWLLPWRLSTWALRRLRNWSPKRLMARPCVTINDGAHGFRLRTHYIRPSEQTRQLAAAGFADVRILTLDGHDVAPGTDPDALRDFWLYYLCARQAE